MKNIARPKRLLHGQRDGQARARIVVLPGAVQLQGLRNYTTARVTVKLPGCAAAADHGQPETARPAIFGRPQRRARTTAFADSIDNPGVGWRGI